MRIIIAGAGSVGTHLVKMFTENNHDVVVIDNDKEKLQLISTHYDVMTIYGEATSLKVLTEAEASKAKLFIAVSNFQETNILSAIIAKRLGAKNTVARIDNEEYLVPENEEMLHNLGVDSLVYPEILAAEEIVRHLKYPSILKAVSFASGKLYVLSIKISKKSPMKDFSLAELAEKYKELTARVVIIQRGNKTYIPYGKDIVRENDVIYLLINKQGREKILDMLGITEHGVSSVMILGGSKIGIKLAQKLEKNYYVKLFEKSREKSFQIAEMLKETLVIHSEARDAEFLTDEGIARTDVFIAVTDNSEINMLSCMLAKKLGVGKTFSEVENTDYLELVKNIDIDYIVNKKLIAASKIFTYSINAEVLNMTFFTDTEVEIFEFVVHEKSKITKKALRDIKFTENAIIGGVLRNNETFVAVGDTILQPNDKVVVFSLPGNIDKLAKWFR